MEENARKIQKEKDDSQLKLCNIGDILSKFHQKAPISTREFEFFTKCIFNTPVFTVFEKLLDWVISLAWH